jgi:hypothetical protein
MAEIVAPGSRVRVEVEKRLHLAPQRDHELRQQRVLEHVGKAAGVEEMAIGKHSRDRIQDSGFGVTSL